MKIGTRHLIGRILLVLLIVALAAAVFFVRHLLIVLFGPVLVAILLRSTFGRLAERVGLPAKPFMPLGLLVLLGLPILIVWPFWDDLVMQIAELEQRLSDVVRTIAQRAQDAGYVSMEDAKVETLSGPIGAVLGQAFSVLQSSMNVFFELIFFLFAALYLALDPGLYRRGLKKLVPAERRDQLDDAMDRVGDGLGRWLQVQVVTMTIVGVVVFAGLMLLGVPLAGLLAVTTALAEFVPIVGPLAAAVPAILVGFGESFELGLWTTGLYIAVNQLEGNVLQPVLQQEHVSLPPVLTLSGTVAIGALFGFTGVVVAVPMVLATMILVQVFWTEPLERLSDRTHEP